MKQSATRIFLSLFILTFAFTGSLHAQKKKRVAVLDFEYGTVQSWVVNIFGTNVDIGKGISDLLVEKLLATGQYSLIERNALDKVLKEQNFSNSDRVNSATAASIGQVLGVDAIIVGSITQFGSDDRSTGLGGFGRRTIGGFGIGKVKVKNAKAIVGISSRIIDINTAEILAAVTAKGESKRRGAALDGAGGSGWSAGGGGIDMSASNFRNTILGEATHQAVEELARELATKASVLPERVVSVEGLVADVAGSTLILNVGTSTGLKVGDKLNVERKVREVRDPASGKVIRAITEAVGTVTITEADASSAVATFSGSGTPKVGDVVKTP